MIWPKPHNYKGWLGYNPGLFPQFTRLVPGNERLVFMSSELWEAVTESLLGAQGCFLCTPGAVSKPPL